MLVYSVMGGRHVRCFFRATTGSGDEVTMDGGSEAEDFPRPMCAHGPAQLLLFRRCEESDGLACIDVVRVIHGGPMVLDLGLRSGRLPCAGCGGFAL
jgi:hypothetical protein